MNNDYEYFLHCASCPTWMTASILDCTCLLVAPWRIVKEPGERFPWRIWRRASDDTYVPFMRASSWVGAWQLVEQMIELRQSAFSETDHG